MQKGQISKEKIKHEAARLFHRQGYNNTSINDILGSSGMKKGCLYFHYDSKKNLFIDVLNDALLNYENQINTDIHPGKVTDQLKDIIDAVANFHINGGITRGCIFGNMALEIGRDDTEVSQFLEKVFKRFVSRFKDLLIQAEKNGELKLKEPPLVLARMIIASIQGGVMLSKISGNQAPLNDCTGFIKSIIDERIIS